MPSLLFTRISWAITGRFNGLQLGAAPIEPPPEAPGRGGTLRGKLLLGTVLVAMAAGGSAWAQGQAPAAAVKGDATAQGQAPAAAVKAEAATPGKAPAAAAVKGEAAPGKAPTAAAGKGEVAAPGKASAAATTKGEAGKAKDAGALPDAFANLPAAPTAKAAAPTSFDELLKDAVPVKDLATLIEPLYAKCDDSDALLRRQCEGTRGYLLDYLKSHTFVADSDVQPETTPYDTVAKQVDMEVAGCVACKYPPTVAGEPRYVTTRPPQRVAEGRAIVQLVASHEISLPDRTGADRFVERVVPRLRVQHVFRFGSPYGEAAPVKTASVAGKAPAAPLAPAVATKGVQIVPLGQTQADPFQICDPGHFGAGGVTVGRRAASACADRGSDRPLCVRPAWLAPSRRSSALRPDERRPCAWALHRKSRRAPICRMRKLFHSPKGLSASSDGSLIF